MKSKRKDRVLFYVENAGEEETYEAIGKDNNSLSTEMNFDVSSEENVLGETTVEATKGPRTTSVDPCYYRTDGLLSKKLKNIEWEDKDGDDLKETFMEVDKTETETEENYKAFQQKATVVLKSYGGDTKGIAYPYELHWEGPKTYGTFNPKTKKFTKNVEI